MGAADEDADFAGAGGQEVGHLREAGEVEAAYGDGHAVGVGVGGGAEVGGEVRVAVGVEDGHFAFVLRRVEQRRETAGKPAILRLS